MSVSRLVLLFCAFTCSCLAASASSERQMLLSEFQQTFQRMIANPADVHTTLLYSDLAAELGDYEAAIPPLERLLLLNANQPALKLRIGHYYQKLGSHEMAKTYLQEAATSRTASAEVTQTARTLLSASH